METWCTHSMRLNLIGLPQPDSIDISLKRALRPNLRAIVFLDMDETLTAANVAPDDYFDEMLDEDEEISDEHVNEYMRERVPKPLKKRVSALIRALEKDKDIEWFILTDNIFPMTRCTMKLAFGIETKPGTIIDRTVRQLIDAHGRPSFISKSDLIETFIETRQNEGLPPVRVVFADNDPVHRAEVTETLRFDTTADRAAVKEALQTLRAAQKRLLDTEKLQKTESFVCCADLKTGLEKNHIEKIVNFLKLN